MFVCGTIAGQRDKEARMTHSLLDAIKAASFASIYGILYVYG